MLVTDKATVQKVWRDHRWGPHYRVAQTDQERDHICNLAREEWNRKKLEEMCEREGLLPPIKIIYYSEYA